MLSTSFKHPQSSVVCHLQHGDSNANLQACCSTAERCNFVLCHARLKNDDKVSLCFKPQAIIESCDGTIFKSSMKQQGSCLEAWKDVLLKVVKNDTQFWQQVETIICDNVSFICVIIQHG